MVHVQADEIRVKGRSMVVWIGMAMMVSTRLWLAGGVSQTRDRHLADRLLPIMSVPRGNLLIASESFEQQMFSGSLQAPARPLTASFMSPQVATYPQNAKRTAFQRKAIPVYTSETPPVIQSQARYLSNPSVYMCSECAWQMAIAAASAASSGRGIEGRSSICCTIYPTCSLRAAP